MAYVSVPRDLSDIKSRVLGKLTKRQLICFGAAAAIGAPVFFIFNGFLGTTLAMMIMIISVLPCFLMAQYSKDGLVAEQYILLILRHRVFFPKIRKYKKEGRTNQQKQ